MTLNYALGVISNDHTNNNPMYEQNKMFNQRSYVPGLRQTQKISRS